MRRFNSSGALSTSVLVLNRAFLAVHVVNVRRAFGMIFRDLAEVIDIDGGQFANYDFESWLVISDLRSAEEREFDDWVRSVNFRIQVPRVIRLLHFDRVPKQSLRFNRRNLFARDNHRCQYCGKNAPPQQLSMDHVLPRSRGGQTTWENIVCCCVKCNTHKGGRTPKEARMQLLKKPTKPRFNPLLAQKLNNPKYESWRIFLKIPLPHSSQSQNGKSQNGKSQNGKSQNGKSQNGKSQNGKSQNGKSQNGKSQNGKSHNGKSAGAA